MKIDYPRIDWNDVQPGDTVLAELRVSKGWTYVEFTLDEHTADAQMIVGASYYLIDRPKPVFPEDYGTVIIAKKVRGIEFPEGVVLTRQRGSTSRWAADTYSPMWKSIDRKIEGKDNHGERQIEDWVLAKVVPA